MPWARFLSVSPSKLRLCSANHRPDYWSNLPCDQPNTTWAYSKEETENKTRCLASHQGVNLFLFLSFQLMKDMLYSGVEEAPSPEGMPQGDPFPQWLLAQNSIFVNFCFALTCKMIIPSSHKFAHVTTAWLSWHVQICHCNGSKIQNSKTQNRSCKNFTIFHLWAHKPLVKQVPRIRLNIELFSTSSILILFADF